MAAAVVALVTACSSGSHPAATNSAPTTLPPVTTTASTAAPTTTAATSSSSAAIAAAINLQAADLPGFTASPHTTTAQDKQQGTQFAACAGGVPPSNDVADINSDDFSSGSGFTTQQVDSDVTVLPTAALVQQDLAAIRSAKAQTCFTQLIDQTIVQEAGGSVHFGNAQITPVVVNVPASDGAFGYRFTLTGTQSGAQITVHVDEFGFARKNYEISLTVTALGQPFSASTEQQLVDVLAQRAGKAIT